MAADAFNDEFGFDAGNFLDARVVIDLTSLADDVFRDKCVFQNGAQSLLEVDQSIG